MNSIVIRQVVVMGLAAILCIALLVGMLLVLSIIGAHLSQTGIMLIAPSYIAPSHQLVDWKTVASPLL